MAKIHNYKNHGYRQSYQENDLLLFYNPNLLYLANIKAKIFCFLMFLFQWIDNQTIHFS